MFDDSNITCMMCDHFTCNQCTKVRWKETWNKGNFWKPKLEFIGLKHEVWNCPSCRDGFDRFVPDGTGRTDPSVINIITTPRAWPTNRKKTFPSYRICTRHTGRGPSASSSEKSSFRGSTTCRSSFWMDSGAPSLAWDQWKGNCVCYLVPGPWQIRRLVIYVLLESRRRVL